VLVAIQLVRQAWTLGQPVPVVTVPAPLDDLSGPILQLADAEGFWTAGESQVGVRIATVTAEELEQQFQLAPQVPKSAPAKWESAMIKWAEQQWPEQTADNNGLKTYHQRTPGVWYRLLVTTGQPQRVCLAQVAWPSSRHSWMMAQAVPVPGLQKIGPASGLIPMDNQVTLAQRWNHRGELTGELLESPSHWSDLRAQWAKLGYQVQSRPWSENVLAGTIDAAALRKGGQPALLALRWGQEPDKRSLLVIVPLKSVEWGEP